MTPKKAVLIVDDHEDVRLSLAEIVETAGYEAHTACDGQEAVDRVKSMPFCFVLMDIRMPRKDGIEAMKEMRELRPEVPVALVSVYDMRSLTQRLLDSGAMAVLSKPVVIEDLLDLLSKHCGQPGKQANH